MKDRIDNLLDDALRSYAEQPRPGLEKRVLHRVRSKGRRWPIALPVFAVAAFVACLVIVLPRKGSVAPVEVETAPQIYEIPKGSQAVSVAIRKPARSTIVLPKQATFPKATPLTEGEQALLSLMRQHPDVGLAVAASIRKTNSEPIEIEPLEIPPLKTESGQ
jgi:hypothetical protein